MGQKIDPRGFRIGVNRTWDSLWYIPKNKYGDAIYADYRLRKYIRAELKSAGVEKIKVKRVMNKVEVEIMIVRPGVVIGRSGVRIEQVKKKLNDLVGGKIELKVTEVKNPDISAQLIADRIVMQLERRMNPKFVMTKGLEQAVATGKLKGIRVWVSGRIRGAEIARREKVEWGTIPLQTLDADIDYATAEAQVPNAGRQGVKVWVYRKE